MGFWKLSVRPHRYAQDSETTRAIKNIPAQLAALQKRLAAGAEMEVRFQDEARAGQKNEMTEQTDV